MSLLHHYHTYIQICNYSNIHIHTLHTYVFMFVCMYVCLFVFLYVCSYLCVYVDMYVYKYLCTCVCNYVCMYVYLYPCIYVCMYILLHIFYINVQSQNTSQISKLFKAEQLQPPYNKSTSEICTRPFQTISTYRPVALHKAICNGGAALTKYLCSSNI